MTADFLNMYIIYIIAHASRGQVASRWTESAFWEFSAWPKTKHKRLLHKLGKWTVRVKPQVKSLGGISDSGSSFKRHFDFSRYSFLVSYSIFESSSLCIPTCTLRSSVRHQTEKNVSDVFEYFHVIMGYTSRVVWLGLVKPLSSSKTRCFIASLSNTCFPLN